MTALEVDNIHIYRYIRAKREQLSTKWRSDYETYVGNASIIMLQIEDAERVAALNRRLIKRERSLMPSA
jgi:hypothetical protein